jgi:hypothetical protein
MLIPWALREVQRLVEKKDIHDRAEGVGIAWREAEIAAEVFEPVELMP